MAQARSLGLRTLHGAALFALAVGSRACAGGAFSTAEATGGTGGGASGPSCTSPDDCDDDDPCTIDDCGPAGTCVNGFKCATGLQCCSGRCSECCGDGECDDGIACTSDTCVSGFCSSSPGACGEGEYCSIPRGGCMPLETCGEGQSCDDGDACTEDSCEDGLCVHSFCPQGGKCCDGRPDLGCNTCCSNSECDDEDLCTDDACTSDGCSHGSKSCPQGTACCPGTGQCSECCSASDCSDAIDCTIDSCEAGICRHVPDRERCEPGEVCVAGEDGGCETPPECTAADSCPDSSPCESFECVAGKCIASAVACPGSLRCCPDAPPGSDPCRSCCEDAECDGPDCVQLTCEDGECVARPDDTLCRDTAGMGRTLYCDSELGCIECETAEDCGTDVCLSFECENNECVSTRRFCKTGSQEDIAAAYPCQDCCTNADCPTSENGEAQKCCHGTCCAGTCDATSDVCVEVTPGGQ